MKLILYLCTALCLVVLPLAADPIAFVALNGLNPGTLLRYSGHSVTTIATLSGSNPIGVTGVGLTKDNFGNYIVAFLSSILRVTPTGTVSTIAIAPSGSQWLAVAADSLGNLIVGDNEQHAIWRITPGRLMTAVIKIANYPVSAAELEEVQVLVDSSGNYLVLEDNNSQVRMFSITPAGTVTPIPLSGASVKSIWGFVSDGAGNYLFGDAAGALYRVTPAGVVTQVASILGISSIAVNPDTGDIVVATAGGQIVQVSADGSLITTIANPASGAEYVQAMVAETYGDLPHLAAGDVWTTGFYVLNTGNQPASYSISFYGDSGSPVSLPFSSGSSSSLQGTLPAQGMTYLEAADPTATVAVAAGLISADPTITVQALFRRSVGGGAYYEAGVPASAGSTAFTLPFDATTFAATGAPLYTGFALANLDPNNSANVTCIATDNTGAVIPNGVPLPALSPLGHYANFLFPALTGKRGTLNCSSNTRMAALALRSIGGSAFSSLPVLYK